MSLTRKTAPTTPQPVPKPIPKQVTETFATLQKLWKQIDHFFHNELTPAQLQYRPILLRFPFIFYYGHLPAFTSRVLHSQGFLKDSHNFEDMFERGMDPDIATGECHDCSEILESWPDFEDIGVYKKGIRKVVEGLVRDGVQGSGWDWLKVVTEHEATHLETLWYMKVQMEEGVTRRIVKSENLGKNEQKFEEMVKIGKGAGVVGRVRSNNAWEFGWDNEFGDCVSRVDVGGFEVGKFPVTVGQYVQFVEDGGYRKEKFWGKDDWAWIMKEKVTLPASWRCVEGKLMILTADEMWSVETAAHWPVYTSVAEARAYARWKGARLLIEAEWDWVAFGEKVQEKSIRRFPWGNDIPISGKHGNFGFVNKRQVDVDRYPDGSSADGVMDLIGNGWELTDSIFYELPGFRPQKDYPEYSVDFFDGKHFVLKGASWATDSSLIRRTLRNFYQAQYRYVFGKFRIVRELKLPQ
eukprot:Plantae.Rhodophyta-Hildenbrandia_rubra.ctg20133.p1 GENE.Plantae.Rhodophyta-Hildenbrandia_rubra.ctg20133~~Plantae.Rhodophyta-Hildenbrandia_rubra.ctg20133.p1  ORF type:complete len:466 (-),score=62.31 Plantae.Rhodophyta-Hildenbrandia_rubra.ctg20133:878-2275(-)